VLKHDAIQADLALPSLMAPHSRMEDYGGRVQHMRCAENHAYRQFDASTCLEFSIITQYGESSLRRVVTKHSNVYGIAGNGSDFNAFPKNRGYII
jgi:hypothetical protein